MKAEIFGGMVCEENEGAEEFAVRTVCYDCAYKAGYKPKNKAIGVWMDTCDSCHQQKPCTDLVHDWKYEISKIANQEIPNQEGPSVMIEDREKTIRKLDSQKMKGV